MKVKYNGPMADAYYKGMIFKKGEVKEVPNDWKLPADFEAAKDKKKKTKRDKCFLKET